MLGHPNGRIIIDLAFTFISFGGKSWPLGYSNQPLGKSCLPSPIFWIIFESSSTQNQPNMKTALSLIACFCAINLPAQVRLLSGVDSTVESQVSSTLQTVDQSQNWIITLLIIVLMSWVVFLCSVAIKCWNLDKGVQKSN